MHTVPKHLYTSSDSAAYILAVIAEHNRVSINTRYSFTKKQWLVWTDKQHKASGKTLWNAMESFIIQHITIANDAHTNKSSVAESH